MLTLHILSLGFVLGVSALADKEALAWLRGEKYTLDRKMFRRYHAFIWTGLLFLTASGLYLFYPMRVFLLRDLLFDTKLLFVGILFVNAFLIGRLMDLALYKPFKALALNEKMSLLLSGVISVFSWFCAAGIALLIF